MYIYYTNDTFAGYIIRFQSDKGVGLEAFVERKPEFWVSAALVWPEYLSTLFILILILSSCMTLDHVSVHLRHSTKARAMYRLA